MVSPLKVELNPWQFSVGGRNFQQPPHWSIDFRGHSCEPHCPKEKVDLAARVVRERPQLLDHCLSELKSKPARALKASLLPYKLLFAAAIISLVAAPLLFFKAQRGGLLSVAALGVSFGLGILSAGFGAKAVMHNMAVWLANEIFNERVLAFKIVDTNGSAEDFKESVGNGKEPDFFKAVYRVVFGSATYDEACLVREYVKEKLELQIQPNPPSSYVVTSN